MAGDVKVAVVSRQLNTAASATTDFTKSGFGTPKAAIVLVSTDTTDNTSVTAGSRISIGLSDFINDYCIVHQDEDNSAKVDCDAAKSNTSCYALILGSGTFEDRGTASAITDGVRLTNSANSGGAYFTTVIMFGGADLAISLQSSAINSSQDGTATVSHSGFTDGNDKLIFFIGTDISTEDSASTGINNSFGVCHATGSDAGGWTFVQRCFGFASDHNATDGAPSLIISTDRVLDIITEAGGQDWGLEVTAFDNSGGTWTVTTRDNGAGAGMEVYSLALDLDDRSAKVGSVDSPASGTDWAPSVSLGFTPQYVGLGLTSLVVEDTIFSLSTAFGTGISSNTGSGEETCHSWANQFGVPTTNTNNLFRSRAVDFRDSDGTTVRQDHQHSSFDSGGWTYSINTFATARKWFYWTIEEAAALFAPDADAFRFYDDGTESGSSPKAAQDIDIELDATGDAQFHIRYRVQNQGSDAGLTTDDYALEVSKNSGSFAAVTAASSDVQSDTASGLTADGATTNRATNGITDGTGSFVAGEQEETNGVIEDHQLTASNFTEHVWACKLINSDLGDGDTLDFRITLNAGAPGMTNTVTPRISTPSFGRIMFSMAGAGGLAGPGGIAGKGGGLAG